MHIKKLIIYLFLALFLISSVYALDCGYKDIEKYQEFGTYLYTPSGDFFGETLKSFDYQGGYGNLDGPCRYSFKVYNNFSYPISVTVRYTLYAPYLAYFHDEVKDVREQNLIIKEYSEEKISGQGVGVGGCYVIENETSYNITSPEPLISKKGYITKERVICRICPNGKQCLNDGESCKIADECGGEFCIQGYCNHIRSCFNNDCKCVSDEIQCYDNLKCVKKNSTTLDNLPKCNKKEECISGYINETTKLCSKSPSQIQKEQEQERIRQEEIAKRKEFWKNVKIGFSLLVLLILLLLFLRYKDSMFISIKKLKKELKGLNVEFDILKDRLKSMQDNIDISEKIKHKTIQNLTELENLYSKKEKLLKDIETEIKNKENKLKDLEEKIINIKNKKNKTKEEIDELILLESKLKKERHNIVSERQKNQEEIDKLRKAKEEVKDGEREYTEPYTSHIFGGIKQWRNPKWNYYPCYVNDNIKTDKLIHKEIAEKQIYNHHREFFKKKYPQKSFNDLEVHHIDHDFENYHLNNLAIISKEEHKLINHTNIPKGNYNVGLTKLKVLGIKQPHIKELNE